MTMTNNKTIMKNDLDFVVMITENVAYFVYEIFE